MRLPLSSIDAKKPIIPIKPTAASANKAPQNREKTANGKENPVIPVADQKMFSVCAIWRRNILKKHLTPLSQS